MKACLPAETMLCAWEMLGMHSLVEVWCMRIGKADSPASGVKESELNAWHAILLRPLALNRSRWYDRVRRPSLNDFPVFARLLSPLFGFVSHRCFSLSFVFSRLLPRLPFLFSDIYCLTLSCVSSSLTFPSSALSLSRHVYPLYCLLALSSSLPGSLNHTSLFNLLGQRR